MIYIFKMVFLHQFVAENFMNYYFYSKPHLRKIKKINSNESINENNNNINIKITSSEIKANDAKIKFNIINVNNQIKKYFFDVNK